MDMSPAVVLLYMDCIEWFRFGALHEEAKSIS